MKKALIFYIFIFSSLTIFSQGWKVYPYTPPGSRISFPIDEGRHSSEPTEWWYSSGHLTGETTGKHYSYMLSYFYNPVSSFDGFRIFNISDDDIGLFSDETMALNYTILATDSFNIEADIFMGGTEFWRNKTDIHGKLLPFEYELSAESSSGALNLEYDALKPPLILADSGFLYQGEAEYTYYYSLTKNAVSGTITYNGITENVSGTSWIDRQYGTFNPSNGQEYEWFCVQLSNGMDINIYNVFTSNDEIPDNSTFRIFSAYIDETTQQTTSDFEIERLKYTYMPDSLMCYSQEWRITSSIFNLDLLVSTLHSNSEVQLPFRFYEGSTRVTGTVDGNEVTGIGFAELFHSYEKPIISIPDTTNLWDDLTPITWQLNNPDDGNPLKYDLEYSINNQQTFLPIIKELADTFYYWDSPPILGAESCWLKVTGYSIDTTLINSNAIKYTTYPVFTDNIENQNLIKLYPNPNNGIVNIELGSLKNVSINVLTINGQLIFQKENINSGSYQFELKEFAGIYFIEVNSQNEKQKYKLILR